MGPTLAIFLVSILSAVTWIAFSALSGRRSVLAILLSICLMLMAFGGAWYSWTESGSLPWTAGYLAFGATAVAATAVGWIRGDAATRSAA